MARKNYLFTSESVSEGHPDKVCDRISDEVVDLFYREALPRRHRSRAVSASPARRSATTNRVVIAGEYRGPESVTHDKHRRERRAQAIKDIGYEQDGFHWKNANVEVLLHGQSADIAQGVDAARQQGRGRRRPGHHVRLCLRRNARADAGADLLRAPDPAGAVRGARARARQASARSRRQEPGDRAVQERQAGRRHPDRRVAPASR